MIDLVRSIRNKIVFNLVVSLDRIALVVKYECKGFEFMLEIRFYGW